MYKFISKSVLILLILPIFLTTSYAEDATDVEHKMRSDNYYAGLSYNQFNGRATQDDDLSWPSYTTTPVWNATDTSIGINFGKYFMSSKDSRNAIEINYIPEYKDREIRAAVDLSVNYKDIISIDLLHLRKFNDKIEYFGSLGFGNMEIGGNQVYGSDIGSASQKNVNFAAFGVGFLYNINDMYDFKLSVKKYLNAETKLLEIDHFSERKFGYSDLYITSATLAYNF